MKQLLIEHIRETGSFYLMFSGGFDSCAVLSCAIAAGVEVKPIWINNGFNRVSEDQIRKQAENVGCNHVEVYVLKPLRRVFDNPVDRCYHCKEQLIKPIIARGDIPVFDGTNASDSRVYRPGVKALRKGGVRSPLAELGITRDHAREIAVAMGADPVIANMESCLATRFNYHTQITEKRLNVIRDIEQQVLKETGDYHLRCRMDDDDHLRIECRERATFMKIIEPDFRFNIVQKGKQIATFVTLDLEGARKNAFDKNLGL